MLGHALCLWRVCSCCRWNAWCRWGAESVWCRCMRRRRHRGQSWSVKWGSVTVWDEHRGAVRFKITGNKLLLCTLMFFSLYYCVILTHRAPPLPYCLEERLERCIQVWYIHLLKGEAQWRLRNNRKGVGRWRRSCYTGVTDAWHAWGVGRECRVGKWVRCDRKGRHWMRKSSCRGCRHVDRGEMSGGAGVGGNRWMGKRTGRHSGRLGHRKIGGQQTRDRRRHVWRRLLQRETQGVNWASNKTQSAK